MIAVLVPAHNEEALIGACLTSLMVAACAEALCGEAVEVIVALDRCTDGTAAIARAMGAQVVEVAVGNVGEARAAAADEALRRGARWLATTDADTIVPPDWLSAQLGYGCDAFCGIVVVDDWLDYADDVQVAFVGGEHPRDGHPHVHGANMGLSAAAYRQAGGFQSLAVSEDVALIAEIERIGARIARKPTPVVTTSARRLARASGGFSDYLKNLEHRLAGQRVTARLDAASVGPSGESMHPAPWQQAEQLRG